MSYLFKGIYRFSNGDSFCYTEIIKELNKDTRHRAIMNGLDFARQHNTSYRKLFAWNYSLILIEG